MDKIANHVTLSRQLEALQKVCSVDPGKQWNAHLLAHAVRQAQQEKEPEVTWVARCQIYPGLVGIDWGAMIKRESHVLRSLVFHHNTSLSWGSFHGLYNMQLNKFESERRRNKQQLQVKTLLLCADSPHAGKEADLAAEEVQFSLSPHNPLLLEANDSQRHALLSACGRQLALIQGPPGTGWDLTKLS